MTNTWSGPVHELISPPPRQTHIMATLWYTFHKSRIGTVVRGLGAEPPATYNSSMRYNNQHVGSNSTRLPQIMDIHRSRGSGGGAAGSVR